MRRIGHLCVFLLIGGGAAQASAAGKRLPQSTLPLPQVTLQCDCAATGVCTCAPGTCTCPNCPGRASYGPTTGKYRWEQCSPSQAALYRGEVQVGTWRYDLGCYYAKVGPGSTRGDWAWSPSAPPVRPPARQQAPPRTTYYAPTYYTPSFGSFGEGGGRRGGGC